MNKANQRGKWGSKLGFILATSGAAVGLGNIQRFPYITAQCGGAAFVILYLACILLLGIPLMLVEFSIGRSHQRNPVNAIEAIKPNSPWKFVGLLGVCTAFFILSYYIVVAGWCLGYSWQMLNGSPSPLAEFTANTPLVLFWVCVLQAVVVYIVKRGISNGIEFFSKIFMPMLVILMIFLAARSLSLPGSWEGVRFYLQPDFAKINSEVFLYALSQAFFSLCIGEAVLISYGSLAPKTENLVESACYIALFDTVVALLSGFIIFPALFSFAQPADQGAGLIFNVMPQIFQQIPMGNLLAFIFFVILSFAAITTCIALLEIPVMYLCEYHQWKRNKALFSVATASFLLSIPSILSHGAVDFLTQLSLPFVKVKGFYNLMDYIWGNLAMCITGLLTCIFAAWVWGGQQAASELKQGCEGFKRVQTLWIFQIKYVAPVVIVGILASLAFN